MADSLVEPKDASAPVAPDVEPTTPEPAAAAAKLPDNLIKDPVMQALIVGSPGAVSGSIKEFEKRPEAKQLLKHKDALMKAGFGMYRSLDGQLAVIFNLLHVHPEEIKQADAAGQLTKIAPPFDDVADAVGKAGLDHPSLKTDSLPQGFKQAPPPAPIAAATPPVAPAPAAVSNKLAAARILNEKSAAPTAGANAGAGNLLKSILKPVI